MIWRSCFVAVLALALLTACSDRERINCPRTKNQALVRTTTGPTTPTTIYRDGRCG